MDDSEKKLLTHEILKEVHEDLNRKYVLLYYQSFAIISAIIAIIGIGGFSYLWYSIETKLTAEKVDEINLIYDGLKEKGLYVRSHTLNVKGGVSGSFVAPKNFAGHVLAHPGGDKGIIYTMITDGNGVPMLFERISRLNFSEPVLQRTDKDTGVELWFKELSGVGQGKPVDLSALHVTLIGRERP